MIKIETIICNRLCIIVIVASKVIAIPALLSL
jgi:hypothetical protein